MKLSDYISKADASCPASKRDVAIVSDESRKRLRKLLHQTVSSDRIAQLLAQGREKARLELSATIEQLLRTGEFRGLEPSQRALLIEQTLDMVLGLGPIERMLKDDSITEIMVNGPFSIFYEKDGALCPSDEHYDSEDQLRLVIDRIISPLGRRIDEQCPRVDARLPEGHRVNAVIPPICLTGSALTIRKFRAQSFTLDELVDASSMSPEVARLLFWAVRARRNIAVSGGTGGGKTTLLNALSRLIPASERIVTIEDSAELRFEHPHVVRLEARAANAEGRGAIAIRDLVINALRMRPDRIIVGECRGAEALDMLQAMNTGHDGSLTTLHANSPAEVVPRLVMMVRYGMDLPTSLIEDQVVSALDLIVQQDRLGGGERRITQIAMRAEQEGQERFIPLVIWNRRLRIYEWVRTPSWIEELASLGIASNEEVGAWLQSLHFSCS